MSHWEREKRAWELEQEKEWTKILSKSAKQAIKKASHGKRVHFAKEIVQIPPKSKAKQPVILKFRDFSVNCATISSTTSNNRFSVLGNFLDQTQTESVNQTVANGPASPVAAPSDLPSFEDQIIPGPVCARCLAVGHFRRNCVSKIRCKSCYNYGHVSRQCTKRIQVWRRKDVGKNPDSAPPLDSRVESQAQALPLP